MSADRYWVYTSRDIQIAHLLQRWCEPAYVLLMRLANRQFTAVANKAR